MYWEPSLPRINKNPLRELSKTLLKDITDDLNHWRDKLMVGWNDNI